MSRSEGIAWQGWGTAAFEQARREDKPVLLSISAVWCHWCHVMDRTSYADAEVIETIVRSYVPIRVDNDHRPDINARYNQGGWPTTAFLTPDGVLIAGATYLPPEQMRRALGEIAQFYREHRDEIAARTLEVPQRPGEIARTAGTRIDASIPDRIRARIVDAYDETYAGFGDAPKFPMTEALDFLLFEHRCSGDPRLYEIVAKTMLAMAGGGMYDPVEGGFFRYSTTRDWSVPHFEKMTEDHAGLLRLLAQLVSSTRNAAFRPTLLSAIGYVREVLRDPRTHLFAGSQDADEAYYALPLDQRRARAAPYVDRTSYSNWSAAMAGAFALAGHALDDERLAVEAEATLDVLHAQLGDGVGLLHHFIEPGAAPRVRGLLADQSAYLRALLDAHEYGGQPRFLQRARVLAQRIVEHFSSPGGGFYDSAGFEAPLGALRLRDCPLGENAILAESFMRLAQMEGDSLWRATALRILEAYAGSFERMGLFAAPYARAVRRFLQPESTVVLVGSPQETQELREAAHALALPPLVVRTVDTADAAALAARSLERSLHPVAYLCTAQTCAAPARTGAQLRDRFDQLARTNAFQYQTP